MTVRFKNSIFGASFGVFACLSLSLSLLSAQGVFDSIGKEVHDVFEGVKRSVVKVKSDNGVMMLTGSGFFIDAEGTLVTSSLIVVDDTATTVETEDGKWDARVLGKDLRSGIALLKVYGVKTKPLVLSSSSSLKAASAVIGVGYPYNLPVAPSFGLVGGFDFQYLNKYFPTTHIRANLPISPGQVGGPLINSKGEVVGVLVMSADEGRSCYAIPSMAVQRILEELTRSGKALHGWVGVGVSEQERSDLPRGVFVSNLFENTPALSCGIKVGDVVLKIGGREIKRPSDVIDVSFFSRVGEELPVVVLREGKQMNFKIKVEERPTMLPAVYRKEPGSTLPPSSAIQVNQK
jgi:S1-C subfamily serine protease